MANWDDFNDDEDEVEVIQPAPLKRVPNGDKIAIARADGIAITEKGNLVTHDWFKKLDTSSGAYASLELTAAEARALSTARNILKTGASAAQIMTCYGAEVCPLANSCTLVSLQREIDKRGEKRSVIPVSKKCPFETEVFYNTVEALAIEFSVIDGPTYFTDQQVVLELAEIAVLEYRVNSQLSSDPQLQGLTEDKLTSIVQTTAGPVENYVKDVADLVKIKEKLSNRKDKLRKELVATRREQRLIAAKEGEVTNDPSVQMAALITKFNEAVRK